MLSIAEFPKYKSYKDSGFDWLGEVPESWRLLANKHIFKIKKNQVGKRSGEYVLLSLTLKGVIKRDMENPEGKFPAEFDTYQEVKSGDFVFCLFDVEETPRAIGLSPFDGMITGAYTVLESDPGFDSQFLYYFYLNLDGRKRLKPLYRGLRNTIPKESFMSFKTFVPTLNHQRDIARFLDKKTTQIDEAIAIKEQQIALLKERKQIIIQKAVTQGLDPNVPMKDSGVDWIGDIPANWEVVKLKLLANKIVDGAHFTPTYVDNGVPFLRVTDLTKMRSGRINWDEVRYIPEKEHRELIKRAKADKGDVLLSKNGTIGLTAVIDWDIEFSFFVSLCLIKLKPALSPNYFASYFNSPIVDRQITFGSSRTSVTNLHLEKIKELLIILPPMDEQDRIGDYINDVDGEYDPAVDLQKQQIEKLKEYKTTLINSAVTGKIKISPDMVEG